MKRLIVFVAGSAAAAAAGAALFGTGVAAAAPDVVGMQYGDAVSEIQNGGGTAVIASRFGSHPNVDECLVTGAWDAPFLRIDSSSTQVNVALNCNGGYATAVNPGPSAASPAGKASKAAEEEQQAQEDAANQELLELEGPATPDA